MKTAGNTVNEIVPDPEMEPIRHATLITHREELD